MFTGTDGRVRSVRLKIGNSKLSSKGLPLTVVSYASRSVHKVILLVESDCV